MVEVVRGTHHGLAVHEVVLLMESDPVTGLPRGEVAARRERYGPNTLPADPGPSRLSRFLRQFHHPLVYVLLAAGGVTVVVDKAVDAVVVLGVVVSNAVVGYVQESRAEAALLELRAMVRTAVRVIREGEEHAVPSEQVVPGDVIRIEAGDKVPADVRLTEASQLTVDESALTGESLPVVKDEVVLPLPTPVADRQNMLYAGTLVVHGTGRGIVVATGGETELGEIHRLVASAAELATPLTRKLAWFSKVLTVVILVLAAVTFVAGLARGEPARDMLVAAVALAVGAIPEGLPAAVTITLAIGVARLARRQVVVRRLPAVETLGSTTVICTDKTGTLTANQMTVTAVWTPDGEFDVTGVGYAPTGEVCDASGEPGDVSRVPALRWCLLGGAACNEAALEQREGRWTVVGDPTEGAMLVVAAKAGLDVDDLRSSRTEVIPFNPARQYMATVHRVRGEPAPLVLVKGSVERVLGFCTAQMTVGGGSAPLEALRVQEAADRLARRGLRVLATAVGRLDAQGSTLEEDAVLGGLVLTGLQAMHDPPRPAAAAAVRACAAAGIAVKMITGDHATTAAAVAEQLGIPASRAAHEVITGPELEELDGLAMRSAVQQASVFARVSPEQKLALVEALQQAGQVVAMTGDGVNDAPSLRQADVGVAMGRGGTEVAKDAADIVLLDDDFASIEAAVEEGRGVFDNITKFIVWTLPTNMGEGLVLLAAVLAGAELPVLPIQILWINMTTAVALGLMLAFEPKEPGVMGRPPRDPRRPLLTRALALRTVLVAALLVVGAWWLFAWERRNGAGLEEARTAALNLFVAVEAFYLFACRSLTRSAFALGLFGNRWVLVGVVAQLVAQLALTYLPAMNAVFDTAPLGFAAWWRILGLAAVASLVVSLDKRLRPADL